MRDDPVIPCSDAELVDAVSAYEQARDARDAAYEVYNQARQRLAAALHSRGIERTL